MDKELQLMKELTEAAGPPGFEVRVHRLMKEKLSALTQEIITDNLGSIVGQHGNLRSKNSFGCSYGRSGLYGHTYYKRGLPPPAAAWRVVGARHAGPAGKGSVAQG